MASKGFLIGRPLRSAIFGVLVFVVGIMAATIRNPARLQAAEGPVAVQVLHIPPDPKNIPPAATMVTLTLELKNSKETNLKIRLIASRDGRLMDVSVPSGQLNPNDQATYQIQVPAPLAAMTYQFVIHQPDGTLTTTPRFMIRRSCIQNFSVDQKSDGPDAEFRLEVAQLIAKARSLERETANYETALKLIEELKQAVNQ